MLGLDYKSEN